MSETSSSVLLFIIGIIVTCMVISFAFILQSGFHDSANKSVSAQVKQDASMTAAEYTKYTEKDLKGTDVIRAVKMLYGEDLQVYVQISSTKDAKKDISMPTMTTTEEFQKLYEKAQENIRVNQLYYAELTTDTNGAITGITFIPTDRAHAQRKQ